MPTGRINWPEIDIANNWKPFTVVHPGTLGLFNDSSAWEFIADRLQDGTHVRYKPPSAAYPDHAYELLAQPQDGSKRIYMKVAIRPGVKKLIGISFHYERNS
jgi:hypothetical protein